MKNAILIWLLILLSNMNFCMEKPSQLSVELGEWHNRTSHTYEVEELSPHEDGFRTAAKSITDLGNGKFKKLSHKVSLEPVGAVNVARFRIYNIDNIDDATILKIEHNNKTNEVIASFNDPRTRDKKGPKPAVVSLDKNKSKQLDLSLIVNLDGKNLESSTLNFTTVKSSPKFIKAKEESKTRLHHQ